MGCEFSWLKHTYRQIDAKLIRILKTVLMNSLARNCVTATYYSLSLCGC